MNMVDWNADTWFAKTFSRKLTEEFKTWWVSFYGTPADYLDNSDEQHEYWARCAFAFMGWCAAVGISITEQENPQ